MKSTNQKRQGMSLIVAVAIMMALSIMAIVFARMMVYERVSANNYCAMIDARFTAFAGMERAAVEMFNHFYFGGVWGQALPARCIGVWDNTEKCYIIDANIEPGRYERNGNRYRVKIVSNAGKFNVNSHIADPPAHSCQINSNLVVRNILYRLARLCGLNDASSDDIAETISRYSTDTATNTNSLDAEDRRWQNMDELCKAIDYDSENPSASEKEFIDNICTNSWIDTTTSACAANILSSTPPITDPPVYYKEYRAPVDINAASPKLLRALLGTVTGNSIVTTYNTAYAQQTYLTNPYMADTGTGRVATIAWQRTGCDDDPTQTNPPPALQTVLSNIATKVTSHDFTDQAKLDAFWTTVASQPLADALRSNADPNVIDTFWNPNFYTQRQVVKGYLWDNQFSAYDMRLPSNIRPAHSTEFCFLSVGGLQLKSEGWIYNENRGMTVAYAKIEADAELGDISTHTTQEQLASVNPPQHTTLPANTVVGMTPDIFGGAVEPRRNYNPGSNLLYLSSAKTSNLPFSGSPFPIGGRNNTYDKLGIYDSMQAAQLVVNGARNATINNLAHDGLVSRRIFGSDINDARYYATNCFSDAAFGSPDGSIPNTGSSLVGNETQADMKVGNYQGTIEFWVKLDFAPGAAATDASGDRPNPIFGLLGITSKDKLKNCKINPDLLITAPALAGKYHEGIQMYVYISSVGQLRASRLYYAFCYDKSNPPLYYGATFDNARDPDRTGGGVGNRVARKDIEYAVNGWLPHTWHHVVVNWNDRTDSIQLVVDGDPTNLAAISLSQTEIGYGISNESEPRDSFFINGFLREECVSSQGYFPLGGTGTSLIHIPGNATIDEVVSYSAETAIASPKRYGDGPIYTNSFTTTRNGILGPIFWLSYPNASTSPVPTSIPSVAVTNYTASNSILTPSSITVVPNNQVISYNVNFNLDSSATSAGVRTPTFDSISLVLFYRSPKYTRLSYQ